MAHSNTLVQIFARAPVPGDVKTRLIPALGAEGAAQLHETMTMRLINELANASPEIAMEIWCEPTTEHPFFKALPHDKHLQVGPSLGERMAHALADGLARHTAVLLIGTDLPLIGQNYIEDASVALQNHDVVLGPTLDGGYGLVGVTGAVPDMFSGIVWGGADVLSATCAKLDATQFSYTLLPTLWDVDTPEDLPRYEAWLASRSGV